MKKFFLARINLLICLIISTGFFCMLYASSHTYQTILKDDIENIAKLTSSTIYSQINNELTKPIFVSQTMANDTFLKDWLREEPNNIDNAKSQEKLLEYLNAIKAKYNYDSVFLVSAQSNIYYFFDGINKIVSPANSHDVWYYDFIKSGKPYKLNVDNDEVNKKELTVFVDCRVTDTDGRLMGVVGVGLQMSQIQNLLKLYENDFGLNTFLIDSDGLIQAHTDTNQIETANIFEKQPQMYTLKKEILENQQTTEMNWYQKSNLDQCLITRYMENLQWYLIVQKDNSAIKTAFLHLFIQELAATFVILILLLLLSSGIIHSYNQSLLKMASTDDLTKLMNSKGFEEHYKNKQNARQIFGLFFIFDIDKFKDINDKYGHLVGNQVLYAVAQKTEEMIDKEGIVSRWGGDEFVGALYSDKNEKLQSTLESLLIGIRKIPMQSNEELTVSIGAVMIENEEDFETLLKKSDKALYCSKNSGRNKITYYDQQPKNGDGDIK